MTQPNSSAAPQVLVEIWDATGNKRQEVQMPTNEPLERILAVLIDRMKFPRTGPDGNLLSYKVHHRRSGKQLAEDATLAEADVQAGDVLRLMPEITAGGRHVGTKARRHEGFRVGHRQHFQTSPLRAFVPSCLCAFFL